MAGKELHLSLVSPASTYFDGPVRSVQIPVHDGLIGVMADHAPMVSTLGFGLLTIRGEDGEKSFVIDGGFLEILNNRLTVLANSAEALEDVDLEAAQKEFEEAQSMVAAGEKQVEERMERIAAARTRIKYATPAGRV